MKNISGGDSYICDWLLWQINTTFSIITKTLVVVHIPSEILKAPVINMLAYRSISN